jgi:mono/diheme cytochrome c family protein
MRAIRFAFIFCIVPALAAGIFALAAWQPAIDSIEPPSAASFDPDLVKRGAELAAIGNCDVCHTAPGGREFEGGVAIPTPFGTIYSTNITPDHDTGIGGWSEAAFQRAMRNGVRRDGAYLYPAFPYDHFTLVSDDDDKALYAYLMTRRPVRAAALENALSFPFNVRLVMVGWNHLFLRPGPYRADTAHDEIWNRGAYLAEGLGHCGACHTPRNMLGAEKPDDKFAGGEAEGWTAYALNASSPAPVPWSGDALFGYLHRGFDERHGAAGGPMAKVAADLRSVPDADVRAIATYVAAQSGNPGAVAGPVAAQVQAQAERGNAIAAANADSQANVLHAAEAKNDDGAAIYTGACAGCHEGPRAMPYGGIDLALSSSISGPNANNLINVVLYGLPAAAAAHAPIMPGFANAIDDGQLAALVRYLRARFSAKGSWADIENSVHAARSAQHAMTASHAPADQATLSGTTQRKTDEAQR